ncbi:hypothetical protein L249_2428 [Ophiocordyceps polyrhachis-furcata BCC 54312]|uniref:Uncharacterized protein n=1 Tax=Ophiocordyceps polyrhachis-furcata BCC 54312 TaxID=1330021 RepID=A0A367LSQ6_9HYPO|nr:hypothetical protein L249_2428 [Ophiocordyceps polyrhachis-furcata BCC 54312]
MNPPQPSTTPSPPSSSSSCEVVTERMRDRQARGKDPYKDDADAEDEDDGAIGKGIVSEPFECRERKAYALSILDRPEQLMMFAQSTNDSIPSQRLRFTSILAGFDPIPMAGSGTYRPACSSSAAQQQKKKQPSSSGKGKKARRDAEAAELPCPTSKQVDDEVKNSGFQQEAHE